MSARIAACVAARREAVDVRRVGAEVPDAGAGKRLEPVRIGDRVSIGARAIIHYNAVIGSDGFSFLPTPADTNPARVHSLGKIIIGDDVVSDSTQILARLETLFAVPYNRGLSKAALAEAWLWEDFADTVLNGFLVAARWADDRNWPRTRAAYFGAMPWPVSLTWMATSWGHRVECTMTRPLSGQARPPCWRRLRRRPSRPNHVVQMRV